MEVRTYGEKKVKKIEFRGGGLLKHKKIISLFVAFIFVSMFVLCGVVVHASDVIYDATHVHSRNTCVWVCGYEEGRCEYGQDGEDCDLPQDEGGHLCVNHGHTWKCCKYSNGINDIVTIPESGNYKIEVSGGQGGDADLDCFMIENTSGGKGGYCSGVIYLEAGTQLIVHVGRDGEDKSNSNPSTYIPEGEWGHTDTDDCRGENGFSSYVILNNTTLIEAYGGGGAYVLCDVNSTSENPDTMDEGSQGGFWYDVNRLSNVSSEYQDGFGYNYGRIRITKLHTHVYTSEVTTQPTCTTDGVRTYTCTGTIFDPGCGHTYTEVISALGHLYPDNYSYATDNEVVNGLAYKNCQRCGIRLDSLWLNRIGVKFQKVDGTYTNEEYKVNGYYYSGNTISWSRDADDAFPYAGTSWVSGSQARVETLVVNRNKVSLDLNSWLDGEKRYSLGECATADVYINGVKVADDVADYCNTNLLYGSTYSIEQMKIKEGYTYNGIHSGYDSLTGTLNGSKWVELDFTTNYYNLSLLKGVGINNVSGGGRIKYGTTVVIDASVNTGYVWKLWSGTWQLQDKRYTFTMPAYDVTLEAIGSPITYQIRYDKGLTNN